MGMGAEFENRTGEWEMNEILESLYRRKSVRAFTEEQISPEDREAILQAALQAPSAGCQLLYTILDITDQEKKEKLAELCDHQPFIAKAKLALVFCADCRKWLSFYREAGLSPREPGAGDLLLAVEDAIIAAQNSVTAAESLGIGSCYIGDVMEHAEEMRGSFRSRPMCTQPVCWYLGILPGSRRSGGSRSGFAFLISSVKIHTRTKPAMGSVKCLPGKQGRRVLKRGWKHFGKGNMSRNFPMR